jgi:hypothetical protein
MYAEGSRFTPAEAMEYEENPDRPNVRYLKRPKRRVSHTRLVLCLLLLVALPIFIGLANKTARDNAEAIQQTLGRQEQGPWPR